jgi:hypothetical protein
MAKILRYKPASGETISNPSLEYLKDVVFNAKASQWDKHTSGDSMLDFYEGDIRIYQGDVSLIFFYDEPYGFFLYYDVALVPVKFDVVLKDENVVEHFVGGEPMLVPSICYRTKEEAWEIIEHFIATEKMHDKYKWVMLSDIDYNRG